MIRVGSGEAVAFAAGSPEELLRQMEKTRLNPGSGPCRLVVFDPTPDRIERARAIVLRGRRHHGRDGGIAFSASGSVGSRGKVAFLYPGVDAEEVRAGAPNGPGEGKRGLEPLTARILVAGRVTTRILREEMGVVPDVVAGHSVGEWTALMAADVVAWNAFREATTSVGARALDLPEVEFLAVGKDAGSTRSALEGTELDLHVALDNCPHQSVLCGAPGEIETAATLLRSSGIPSRKLNFQSGFHTPYLRGSPLEAIREVVENLPVSPPLLPVWSATTVAPYPSDPDAIRRRVVEHLVRPVRFRELVERLYEDGVRAYVQMGPGALRGFVRDVLRGSSHLALSTSVRGRRRLDQIRRTVAALWVEGFDVPPDRFSRARGSVSPESGQLPSRRPS